MYKHAYLWNGWFWHVEIIQSIDIHARGTEAGWVVIAIIYMTQPRWKWRRLLLHFVYILLKCDKQRPSSFPPVVCWPQPKENLKKLVCLFVHIRARSSSPWIVIAIVYDITQVVMKKGLLLHFVYIRMKCDKQEPLRHFHLCFFGHHVCDTIQRELDQVRIYTKWDTSSVKRSLDCYSHHLYDTTQVKMQKAFASFRVHTTEMC